MACYNPKTTWMLKTDHGGKPLFSKPTDAETNPHKWRQTELPCGKCIGCRLDYSRQWATRITEEMKLYPENYFLTLTYDDLHVPWGETINKKTGEIVTNQTLRPSDLTQFIKKLRRNYEYHTGWQGIRFFAAGEYGSQTQRPHYHAAMLNMPIAPEEMKKIGNNKQGDELWECPRISEIWGKGYVTIGKLTWQSAAYVARYITKKQIGKESEKWYQSQGIEKEFVRMSRNPGIGMPAILSNSISIDKIMQEDKIRVAKKIGTLDMKVPQYFNRAYRAMEPEQMEIIEKKRQERAETSKRVKLSKTTLMEHEQLKIEEHKKEEQAKKLIRTIEL